MKRIIIAAAIGGALLASLHDSRPTFACTGPGAIDGMLRTELIFEGRVLSVEGITETPDSSGRVPKEITFEVARGHRGVMAGETVRAIGPFPVPGKPIMCPQFPEGMVNKYVIIGADTDAGPLPLVDAWNMVFLGDEPAGDEYERAVRFVEMMSDSNPNGPLVSFGSPVATCGELLTFHGTRIPPGRYVLHYAFSGRIVATPTVGADGEFTATASITGESCRRDDEYHALVAFHLRQRDPDQHLGEMQVVEVASIPRLGALDREPWGPLLTFDPPVAHCGESLTVAGAGFEPRERLRVGLDVLAGEREVVADAEGNFNLVFELPGGQCGGVFLRAWVNQAEFDLHGPLFALTGRDALLQSSAPDLSPTPAPPNAGSGTTFSGGSGEAAWWNVVVASILALALAGGAGAIARSAGRR